MSAEIPPWEKGLYFGAIKIITGSTGGRVTIAREGETREPQLNINPKDYGYMGGDGQRTHVWINISSHGKDKNAKGHIRHKTYWEISMPNDGEKFDLEPGADDFPLPGNRFLRHEL